MNNFENVDLVYYGEDVYFNQNKEYHDMQKRIQKYLMFLVDTMVNHEFEKKSIEAKDFILDLLDAAENISFVKKHFNGDINKITVSDKYIVFDYVINKDNKSDNKTVIIDKEKNEFNFISNKDDIICDITSYEISKEGIKEERFEQVDSLSMVNDNSISESLSEIKDTVSDKKIAV